MSGGRVFLSAAPNMAKLRISENIYRFCMEDRYKGFLTICEYRDNLLNNNI